MRVLVVDDDDAIRELVVRGFKPEGMTVTAVATVAAALDELRLTSFDLLVLDLTLPDGSGLDVLRALRESGSTAHVIILSGADCEVDRVRALELGADDYVVKPFFVRELTARVLAVRRRRQLATDTTLRYDRLEIDVVARTVIADGSPVELTPKEFDLLAFLAARPGHAFSRDELLRAVWESASEWQQTATVTEHVRRLRTKLESDPRDPKLLVTVRGAGYRFDPPMGAAPGGDAVGEFPPGTLVHIEGTIVHADDAMVSLLGVGAESDLVGTLLFDRVAPGSLAAAHTRMTVTKDGHPLQSQIMTITRADGTELPVEVATSTVDWRGERAGCVVLSPAPDRSASLRRLATGVLGELSDAVVVSDLHDHVRSWNGAASRLFGWAEAEVLDRHILDVLPWPPGAPSLSAVRATLDETGRWYGERDQIARDGSSVSVHVTTNLVRDDSGEAVGIASIMRPVAEPGRAEPEHDRGDLRGALDRGEFAVHYQPVVDLDDGSTIAVEALVRWNHPVRGLLRPDSFIAEAERTGLIVELGQFVLERACADTVRWLADGIELDVSVNLSTRELEDPELFARISATLASTGLDPHALWLEVTETALVVDVEQATNVLTRLAALGIRISIDDFGTGWASLTYLRAFPVHALKIDRSFVEGIEDNPHDAAIVRSIIDLAHELGLQVVAEGIETSGQSAVVQALGCSVGQGYLFGRPAPPEAVAMGPARQIETVV